MDSVLTAMVGEQVGPGDRTQKLIQLAKEYIGFEYCLALRSPVYALEFALRALELPPGSGVVVSALAPRYYKYAVLSAGLSVLYADVDEKNAGLDIESAHRALAESGRALVVHHTLGLVPELGALAEFGLPIIEDCSQSFGAHSGGARAGAVGAFTILGLEEGDVLTAGGGALLYVHERRTASVLRRYADYPEEYMLPDLNASLAIAQIKAAERNFQKRRDIAAVYEQAAARTRHGRLRQSGEDEPNYFAFPLVLETGTKDTVSYCAKKEIALELAFDGNSLIADSREVCPKAASLALRTVLFPLYPRLSKTQVERAAKVLATLP